METTDKPARPGSTAEIGQLVLAVLAAIVIVLVTESRAPRGPVTADVGYCGPECDDRSDGR